MELHDTGLARFSSISVTRFAIIQQFLCQAVVRHMAAMNAMHAMESANRAKAANIRMRFLLLCSTAHRGSFKWSKRSELVLGYAEIARNAKSTIAICQVGEIAAANAKLARFELCFAQTSALRWQIEAGM